jgi:hypothetical protein
MSADPIAAVRTVLLADDDTAALVSTRIYGGEVPEPALKAMPQATIVLNPVGGIPNPGGGFQNYGNTRIDVCCYGATLNEAWKVYLAAYTALKQMRPQHADDVLLHSADVVSKGTLARDPVTQWPTVLSTFSVLAAEIVTA